MPEPLLKLESVSMHYQGHNGNHYFTALDNINFHIDKGKSMGLVGQSGAGKSTLARLILGLESPSRGRILMDGLTITSDKKEFKKKVQIVWQDSSQYLNPFYSVEKLIAEPLEVFRMGNKEFRQSRIRDLIALTGLTLEFLKRKPHELSGGQCQRVAIARALAVNPKLLICDEPFSGLDIPSQLCLMKLFAELYQKSGITYLLISHDIAVVKSLCKQIAVLKNGRIVELAETKKIFNNPSNAYTKKLIETNNLLIKNQRQ